MSTSVPMNALELINALYDRGLSYATMARLADVPVITIRNTHRSQDIMPLSVNGINRLHSHLVFLQSFDNDEIDKAYYYEEHLAIFSFRGVLYTAKLYDVVESGVWDEKTARDYILSLGPLMDHAMLNQRYPQFHEFKVVTANDGYKSIVMDGMPHLSQTELVEFFPELTIVP